MSGLNRKDLRWIAIVTMFIDHIGMLLTVHSQPFPLTILLLRGIGRIAFPIYAYQYVEGLHKTSNLQRMTGRLFLLAVLSEIPYDLIRYGRPFTPGMNIIWLFATHAFLVLIKEKMVEDFPSSKVLTEWMMDLIILVILVVVASTYDFDYGAFCAILVSAMYLDSMRQHQSLGGIFLLLTLYYYPRPWSLLGAWGSVYILSLYNPRETVVYTPAQTWFFRLFYPAHQLVLWLIALLFF